MIRSRTIAVVLLSAALSLPAAASDRPATEAEDGPSRFAERAGKVSVGAPMPAFAGPALDGVFSLVRFLRGEAPRATAVTLFATWCTNCKRQLPRALSVVRALAARGVRLVVVDTGEEDEDAARRWFADQGVVPRDAAVRVVFDPFQSVTRKALGIDALPRTFVLDGTGKVVAAFVHEGDDFEAALQKVLDRVIAPASASAMP